LWLLLYINTPILNSPCILELSIGDYSFANETLTILEGFASGGSIIWDFRKKIVSNPVLRTILFFSCTGFV